MTLLVIYAALAIGVSFLCSMLEAALLSLPHSYVELLVDKRPKTGRVLHKMKEQISRPLTAILTFNTIANTVGAVGVGAQATIVFGQAAIGFACAILTLLILVVSEIIPKTLGAVHAKALAGVTAFVVQVMTVLCFPIILALEWMNRSAGYVRRRDLMSRAELGAAIRLGQRGGALGRREFRIICNLLALGRVRLSDVLTPRTVVFALPQDMTVEQAISQHQPIRFARIPIYRRSADHITGYVARFDVREAYFSDDRGKTLEELAKPILILPELASVADALELMLEKQGHIALVVDEHGGTAGIITLEDTLEALLGQEIVDETDLVEDMQKLAKDLKAGRSGQGLHGQ